MQCPEALGTHKADPPELAMSSNEFAIPYVLSPYSDIFSYQCSGTVA